MTSGRPQRRPLAERVCLVAGATRGAGRGTAVALGEAGATVYCTGRTARGRSSPLGRPETLEETAKLVDEAGGEGIAVRCDHGNPEDLATLAQRVADETDGLDLLVNSLWGGDPLTQWGTPFWEMDMEQAWRMVDNGVRTHLFTNRALVPAMVERGEGLVVELTDGDTYAYRGELAYDLVKTALIRLAFAMETELADHGVHAVAVTPGFLRSEAVLDHFGVTEASWQDATAKDPHFAHSETPRYVGRCIAALAADPRRAERAGRVWASWTLAKAYGVRDVDGRQPDWGAHFAEAIGTYRPLDDGFYAYWRGWEDVKQALEDANGSA